MFLIRFIIYLVHPIIFISIFIYHCHEIHDVYVYLFKKYVFMRYQSKVNLKIFGTMV